MMKLRIQAGPDDGGGRLPSWATVEWVGRGGHASSYGLLRGARSDEVRIAIMDAEASHRDALASRLDEVRWGLPGEYEAAVRIALESEPQRVVISRAAHGQVGSSPTVFAALTRFLCRVLAAGLPGDDRQVWRLWDRC